MDDKNLDSELFKMADKPRVGPLYFAGRVLGCLGILAASGFLATLAVIGLIQVIKWALK